MHQVRLREAFEKVFESLNAADAVGVFPEGNCENCWRGPGPVVVASSVEWVQPPSCAGWLQIAGSEVLMVCSAVLRWHQNLGEHLKRETHQEAVLIADREL